MITSYIPLYYILNLGHKVYNWIRTDNLTLINIGRARDFFLDEVILFTWAATIAVVHPLEVETQAKVESVICGKDFNSLYVCRINGTADPEPWTNLQLWGQPQV